MEETCGLLSDSLLKFKKSTECPELFVDPQQDKREIFKSISKTLYDIGQSECSVGNIPSRGLPKLIIKGFDDEQIWQQLDLQNNVISFYNKYVKKLDYENLSLGIDTGFGAEENGGVVDESAFSDASKEGYAFDDSDTDDTVASEDDVGNNIVMERNELAKCPSNGKKSIVDDQFFKLHEMEEFLQTEDLKHERGLEELSDESDNLEFFEDIPSDEEDLFKAPSDDDDSLEAQFDKKDASEVPSEDKLDLSISQQKGKKSARDLMYKDFFVAPQNGVEVTRSSDRRSREKDESFYNEDEKYPEYLDEEMKYNQEINSKAEEKHMDSDCDTTSEKNLNLVVQTAFEKQQLKERKKMKELQESLLKDKPWQLTGEIDASSRPKNSLVNMEIEFDSNAKQDLVITDEVTDKIENIIKMVISNKAWSDVEVKIKPLDAAVPYKPPVELDQTKSKKSLAELYEDEYLKKQQKEKEEDPKHVEITKMMDALVPQLNAFFCHIPKPPVPEIKVVSNLPAITIEEVAPVAVSDAALLAPEEIKAKPAGVEISKTERTDTDKKRERRKKKKFQKFRYLRDEERERKKAVTSEFAAKKYAKLEAMKKISQNRNTIIVEGSKETKVKSSKDFFSRLQDTVSSKMPTTKVSDTDYKKKKYRNWNRQT